MARGIPRIPPDRDLSIDFARALCLPVVVLLHALQMGIGGDPLTAFNALDGWEPLAWGTWVGMIMPTFFICGGFAGITTWRRLRHRGETVGHYIRTRTLRLVRPVVTVMAAVLMVLGVMALAGVDPELLRTFAVRLAEPLWFIAVYIAVTAFVPAMSWLHHHAAWATYFGLAGIAVAIDLVARFGGVPIGALNWLVIWLFAQQLGFGVRDGWYARRPVWLLLTLAAAAYGLMAFAVLVLGYSNDMLDNLNPPTVLILLLALAQVYLFTLLQPAIRRLMTVRPVLLVVGALGMFGMVIYLWHTVAMAVVLGGQLWLGLPFPEPLTIAWWWTRIPWVAAIAAVIAVCCTFVPAIERRWPEPSTRRMPIGFAILWSIVAMVGVGWVLTQGYVPWWNGVLGLALVLVAAIALTAGGPSARTDRDRQLQGTKPAEVGVKAVGPTT